MATARSTTELHGDGPPLLDAFARREIDLDLVPWGDDRDWSAYDGVVVRTTWDYIDDRAGFLDWAAAVGAATKLGNPVDVLAWNTDKRYLRELAASGLPVVLTHWVEPGDEPTVPEDWDDIVVKPAVSAGARRSARYGRDGLDAARRHIDSLVADGITAMVQPYVTDVDRRGETGTYLFGGVPSHAITKGAVLHRDQPAPDDMHLGATQPVAAVPIDADLVAFARRTLDLVPGGPTNVLYARVDTVSDETGAPMILEVELTEPFLWLETDASRTAADRFAQAVVEWVVS